MDLRTLVILCMAFQMLFLFLYGVYKKTQIVYDGFNQWLLSLLILSLGYLAVVYLPDGAAVIFINNLCFTLALTLRWMGLHRFLGLPALPRGFYGGPFAFGLAMAMFLKDGESMPLRVFLLSCYMGLIYLATAYDLFRHKTRNGVFLYRATAVIGVNAALFSLARGAHYLFLRPEVLFGGSSMERNFFLAIMMTEICLYLLYLMLSNRRTINRLDRANEELRRVMGEMKQLQGILPICSVCKKIRDDKGYWNRIEHYIETHTEADFSHSLCPECAEKLYPDFNLDFKEEKRGLEDSNSERNKEKL